VVLTDPT